MAIHEVQNMSGGQGSEVKYVVDDVTGALHFKIGNDKGSPLVRVGGTLADGTVVGPFEVTTKTVREIEYDDPDETQPALPGDLPAKEHPEAKTKPKVRATEEIVREDPVVRFDELDSKGRVIRKRVRQKQIFRKKQAIPLEHRARVQVVDDGEGNKQVNFRSMYRQEVY